MQKVFKEYSELLKSASNDELMKEKNKAVHILQIRLIDRELLRRVYG